MEVIKSYTDIEQSKELVGILPIESADGFYEAQLNPITDEWEYIRFASNKWASEEVVIPCWSLATLLEVIGVECRMEKTPLDQSGEFTYSMVDDYNSIRTFECGNPVDACVEMIYELKDKDLL